VQVKGRPDRQQAVQSSRRPGANAAAKKAFQKVKKCYRAIYKGEQRALDKAREAGKWLNKARTEIKKSGGGSFRSILRSEIKEFGENSVANAYNYIKIFKEWEKIKQQRKVEPELSIDGALRFLRSGESKPVNRMNVAAEKLYAEIAEEGLEDWTAEEKTWLSDRYAEVILQIDCAEILRPGFEKLRRKVQQQMNSSV
jgi:hypothetical protein